MSETIPTQTPVTVPTGTPRSGPPLAPPGSVNTEALQNESVTSAKIANRTITAENVKPETLTEELLAAALKALLLGNERVTEAFLVKAVQEKLNPGAWTELEALNKVSAAPAGLQTCRVRAEDGKTMARFRGALSTTAKLPGGTHIFTLPAAFHPPGTLQIDVFLTGREIGTLEITATGEASYFGTELAEGHLLLLDGVTYNLT